MNAAQITQISDTFVVAESHPALPGHFPGRPVVPGVVLLDRVAALIERAWAARVCGLTQAKFLRPLLPGQVAQIHIDDDGSASVRFRIEHAHAVIASGSIEVAR